MRQPDLGKKISELRLAKGLTQSELADKCNIGLRTIQRIESAEVTPRSYTLKLIFANLDYETFYSGRKEDFLKSNYFKILLPILIVILLIALARNGYEFGQWLYSVLN